ncbi:MAG: histidine kinase [Bacteroidia bacterium]
MYLAKGDYEQATSAAHEVLKMSQEINFKAQISSTLNVLKEVAIKKGNYKQALIYYEQFVSIRNEINKDETLLKAQEKEYAYNLENKKRENLLLVQQNQIQQFQINKNRYLLGAFIFLLTVLLIIGYLLFRQSKIKAENLKMTTEQKLLRAQMNPHFIFNSLNSIKYFINVNQKEQADTYLSTFSKLVRNMMESSIEDSHNLKEESEMLKSYLEIEALRFNSVFTYEINIDEKLKQIVPRIPQLMIQPFVENAIWHGLLSKNGDKSLTVSFNYNSPDKISCVIDDNGIGRKASESKRSAAKKQRAVEFAKQRINLMRKSHKIDCKLVITDKYDDENNPTGTTVFIELPILRNNPK